jgi:hypothetical protein
VTLKQALSAAADLMEMKGWAQGNDNLDGVCLVQAVVNTSIDHMVAALNRVREVIGETDLIAWNDTHGRTQAEVVMVLRKAARL